MNKIKLSIIVPIYKYHDCFENCLKSLVNLKSQYRYEILLECFGSDQKIIDIVNKYEKEYPELIHLTIHETNYGVSLSRNDGILKARGEYICFVDNDDIVDKNYLTFIFKKIDKYPDVDILSFGYYSHKITKHMQPFRTSFKGDGKKVLKYFFNHLNFKFQVYCWLRIYKTDFIRNNNIWFTSEINIYEDWPFFAKSFYYAKKVKFFRKQLYYYVQRKGSAVHKTRDSLYYNLKAIEIIRKHLYSVDKEYADSIFKNISKQMKLHMLLVSYQSKDLYNKTTKDLYKEAKIKLKDVYDGKEIDYGPKKIS